MAEPLVNPAYFDAIKEQIDTVFDCADLQELTNEVMQAIADQLNGIAAQMGLLLPLQALLQLPTNPNEIIDYLDTLVNALVGPLIEPFFVYQQQVIEIMVQVQEITDLLQYKSSILGGCGGGVLIPSLPNVDINLGGIVGGKPKTPTSTITSQLAGLTTNLTSAVNLLGQIQQRTINLENSAVFNVPELESDPDPSSPTQAWLLRVSESDYRLSFRTANGIKRVSLS